MKAKIKLDGNTPFNLGKGAQETRLMVTLSEAIKLSKGKSLDNQRKAKARKIAGKYEVA